ncbi:MAG: peptide deformylase [Deltaproteobacteria bacterium CG2_30_63_29]|nr:MAG: peptide deformylase [Deltaproteobacteria bacterium CG2_30_63_29]PJB35511.1 MAG: peptide deformylase [Deltaproteobacteria bacterium CG_4_9_14_3_um_filter_63_12]
MAVLDIVLYPEAVLKAVAKPVKKVSAEIQRLVDNMLETMYAAPGIGLAAPQVGVSKRLCVVDVSNPQEGEPLNPYVLINPEIIDRAGKILWEEGCLSLPGLYREVQRSSRITVRALDRQGVERVFEAEDLLAVCIQHEMDHLDGIVFPDRLSLLKKKLALKEWKRLREKKLEDDDEGDEAQPAE